MVPQFKKPEIDNDCTQLNSLQTNMHFLHSRRYVARIYSLVQGKLSRYVSRILNFSVLMYEATK